VILAAACAPAHRGARGAGDAGTLVGVYRATIEDAGKRRHAKLSLWAMRPDRLHAELLAPVGGVRLVLDAGGDAACIVDVPRATAFAGGSGPEALAPVVGVRVSIAEAVAALLDGTSPPGLTVLREGEPGLLPATLRIDDGARSVRMERLRLERREGSTAELGTGTPPAGIAVRPLEDLSLDADEE